MFVPTFGTHGHDDAFLTQTSTKTDGSRCYYPNYPAGRKQVICVYTRHYVSKRKSSPETDLTQPKQNKIGDCSKALFFFFFFLKTVLLRAPLFLTVTTEVHVDTCYREMGSPCLSRVAFSFSTLILARSSSSSSSCFLFSPSLFSSRYRATFL